MATIDMTTGTVGTVTNGITANQTTSPIRMMSTVVDFAAATTSKGSALAANDVLQVLDIPANSQVMMAGFHVLTAMTGTSTNLALDLGFTGGDVDNFCDGFDYDGASVGDVSTRGIPATASETFITATDTLDILIQAQTGTFTGGKVRVWAIVIVPEVPAFPGVATAGS